MDTHPQDENPGRLHRITRLIRAGVHFLYSRHFKPRARTEDGYRREFMLNVILVGSIALLAFLDASLLYNTIIKGSSFIGATFWKFSLLVALFMCLYALSRKGLVRTTSYAVIGLYFLGASASAASWGVTLPANLLGFALIITISSVLISSRFGFVMSMVTFATLLTLGSREISRGVLPAWKAEMVTISDIVVYAVILLLITLISWLSNRETEYSLRRARQSEAELTLEKGSLEAKVRERTSELQKAQVERMTQMSRFAEFGRLSSGLFHDLVSPLSAIAMNLQELEGKSGKDTAEIRDLLDRAMKASKRMGIFTSSIKKQIRADNFREAFSPNDVIEEAVSLFHYKAARSGIFIHFSAEQKLSLYGNPIKFHQIFSNLISNAIDSYQCGAQAKGSAQGDKEVSVTLKRHRDSIIATVEDRGCGISEEALPKIYDQFFTTKPRDVAMGLGLSTVKDIVEGEFGGAIKVTSAVGKGTKFTVTVPRNQDNHATP